MENQKNAPRLGENKMRTMPIGKLLFTMALPLAASMLVQAFYNIVDTYFVSLVSADATGALSFAFPIQNLQIGFATGIAVGVNSLLSRSLGEGNRERANLATPVFLPGESQGRGSLVGCRLWGHTESDRTGAT